MSCTNSASPFNTLPKKSGAGDESRTRDLNLGKVALYQLSYSRVLLRYCFPSHAYFVVQRRSEIMSKALSCVKGFSRPFSKNLRHRHRKQPLPSPYAPPRSRICGHASFM
ncbi:hypothetical protein BVIET440_230025 [Burkholderia vietnamiensis]